jgi:hypothetical protein
LQRYSAVVFPAKGLAGLGMGKEIDAHEVGLCTLNQVDP